MRTLPAYPLIAGCALIAAGCTGDSVTNPSAEVASLVHSLPNHAALRGQLRAILEEQNGGLGFEMWRRSWIETARSWTWCSAASTEAISGRAAA